MNYANNECEKSLISNSVEPVMLSKAKHLNQRLLRLIPDSDYLSKVASSSAVMLFCSPVVMFFTAMVPSAISCSPMIAT